MIKIRKLKRIVFLNIIFALGIQCSEGKLNKHDQDLTLAGSARDLVYPTEKIKGIPFELNTEAKSFDPQNNFWMSYFAALQYSHFSLVARQLESLGFGNEGETRLYLKRWYNLRLAKIFAGVKDVDDTWETDDERKERLRSLLSQYLRDFPKDAETTPKKVDEAEQDIIGVHDDGRKISFISGKYFFDPSRKTPGTTQLFYAEHRSLPLAIVVFRGTEKSEKLDVGADLLVGQESIPSQPGKMMGGFMAAYGEIDSELRSLLELRESKNPNLKIVTAGHSLGGALTTAFSARFMDLQNKGSFKKMKLCGVYTLGSPRVGDEVFAARYDLWFHRHQVPVFRIRNYKDVVTGIPFGAPGTNGFWHVGSLVYYDENGDIHYATGENGFSEIEEKSDIKQAFPKNIKDHDVGTYVERAHKALLKLKSAQATRCNPACTSKMAMPYFENPKLRTKAIDQLLKEYDTLNDN